MRAAPTAPATAAPPAAVRRTPRQRRHRKDALRIGYLLTAALAGQRYGEASGIWRQLTDTKQEEVIIALGEQARSAVGQAGVALYVDFSRLSGTSCLEALISARAAFEGSAGWQPPQCPHCRELVASALAEIQLHAAMAAGMSASSVDLVCQGKAISTA